MQLVIEKPRLPKGFSYVLKTSQLEAAFQEAELDCYVQLVYRLPVPCPGARWVLECHYWLPNAYVDYDRFHLAVGAVDSAGRKSIQDRMIEDVVPKLTEWMQGVLSLPRDSPSLRHGMSFQAMLEGDNLEISLES